MSLFRKRGSGIRGSSTVSAGLLVEKDASVQVHGFREAKQRLEKAIGASTDPDENANDVYCSLVEACEWAAMLAKRKGLMSDNDARAVIFTRDRHHHHAASTAEFKDGRWQWRPAALLPSDLRHPGQKRRPAYDRIVGQPLLEVLNRLEPKITA